MRRPNNRMRCTMGESRLSSLAIMYIKCDMPIDLDEVDNLFEGWCNCKVCFTKRNSPVAGNMILGDLGDTCLIHTDVWRCFQYKDSGAGELGGLSVCSEIACSRVEFCKTFRVLSRYVSLCMNVPSQMEILLLWLKIPVILDLIQFEIFTWRLLKIAFPGF